MQVAYDDTEGQAETPSSRAEPNETKEMVNSKQDPVDLAKKVQEQMLSFPKRKSLEWKIDFLKWKFEKQNLDDCCKKIVEGAEVALKVEERLVSMEARVKTGEGDEELRLKVELSRRKIERYYCLMQLLSVSNNPGEFAACVGNLNSVNDGESQAENVEIHDDLGFKLTLCKVVNVLV